MIMPAEFSIKIITYIYIYIYSYIFNDLKPVGCFRDRVINTGTIVILNSV